MGEILFLAHRIPFPPNRGDKIRSHHLLKALAAMKPVHVGTFAETAEDRAGEGDLSKLAASYCLTDRSKPLVLAGLQAVFSGKPISLTAFESGQLSAWIARTLDERQIDTIVVFSGQMGQFVPEEFGGRIIIDLCDVDSAKFAAYAADGQRKRINNREARLLSDEEARLAKLADVTLLISESEAQLLKDRTSLDGGEDIRAVGNGIDASFFDPSSVAPHPDFLADEANFVFTGQMDYPPNVAAVTRFAEAIMPLIGRGLRPRFHIVGRAPSAEVLRLAQLPDVYVWGEVADVRPFIAGATAIVAPMNIARGVQNKVLEAMAMARPVVLSPEAATGIQANDGQHFLVCRDENSFAEGLARIARGDIDGDALGVAARDFVVKSMSWEAVYRELAQIVDPAESQSDAA